MVVIEMENGKQIKIELYPEAAPITCRSGTRRLLLRHPRAAYQIFYKQLSIHVSFLLFCIRFP